MNEAYFRKQLGAIYGTFGKAWPQPVVIAQIYKRVERLPEAFIDYALERCENMESLPANMGRFLRNELWPDFLAANPQCLDRTINACPRCERNTPGYKEYFEPDGTWHLCACDCCTDERIRKQAPHISDFELQKRGFHLKNPVLPSRDWRESLESSLSMQAEQVREGHRKFMATVEAGCEVDEQSLHYPVTAGEREWQRL